nr:hypothetical protein [Tanacetum cinerariifolium]
MQLLYYFINSVHVDYVNLLWKGLHYSLEHLSKLIPYPRFTKIILSHYMTTYPKISRRVRDKYHNLKDDEMVKSIFNSGKNKAGVGMKIMSWMITDEMKHTENYQMYDAVLGVDVPTTQSQPIELCIPSRRSTRLTTLTPISTTANAEDIILQDTIQLSIVEQKSHDELKAKQNLEKVKDHLIVEEIEKLVKEMDNVGVNKVDSYTPRKNDNQNDLGTQLEIRSNKESLKVDITA